MEPGDQVHPRARGERPSRINRVLKFSGSSPRARGTVRSRFVEFLPPRFIPARAGNGRFGAAGGVCGTVHPRARGERQRCRKGWGSINGSSPRARGTGTRREAARTNVRFIPARAGNGQGSQGTPVLQAVHPRARGERGSGDRECHGVTGSSPRARGTGRRKRSRSTRERFIPARAGNGGRCDRRAFADSVHPRARGERSQPTKETCRCSGSSPRARGTDRGADARAPPRRFIPARAGNGRDRLGRHHVAAVHPRARGERVPVSWLTGMVNGSSPRARGTDLDAHASTWTGRFIPARAGNG